MKIEIDIDTKVLKRLTTLEMSRAMKIANPKIERLIRRYVRSMRVFDTGALHSSVHGKQESLTKNACTYIYKTGVYYDIWQHEGTRFYKGRPFLKKAIESNDIKHILGRSVSETIKGA